MLEKEIERKLVLMAKKRGCIPVKLLSSNYNGLPDRLILSPGENVGFIELKAPGKKPRALQLKRHRELRSLGFKVFLVDSIDMIEEVLDEICAS
ncbi:VRR-NUC domain-containing protein [Butyrivibrio proteoclasticus]|uniref:VRR-NUC domain-containing protein n=1 Tax=Butyrivibrio proteoclasticus TaxID=43305 RepID=UPI00047CDD34|nr:VRR-NUC domain-containing protein [Butyrivibrio proteoclasticus]